MQLACVALINGAITYGLQVDWVECIDQHLQEASCKSLEQHQEQHQFAGPRQKDIIIQQLIYKSCISSSVSSSEMAGINCSQIFMECCTPSEADKCLNTVMADVAVHSLKIMLLSATCCMGTSRGQSQVAYLNIFQAPGGACENRQDFCPEEIFEQVHAMLLDLL